MSSNKSRTNEIQHDGAAFWYEDKEETCKIIMPIDSDVGAKRITYKLMHHHSGEDGHDHGATQVLTMGVASFDPVIEEEELSGPVDAEESFWMIDDIHGQRSVVLELAKRQRGRWNHPLKRFSTSASVTMSARASSNEQNNQEDKKNGPSSAAALRFLRAYQLVKDAHDTKDASHASTLLEEAVELAESFSSPLEQALYRVRLADSYNRQWRLVEAADQCQLAIASIPITVLLEDKQGGAGSASEHLILAKKLLCEINYNLGDRDNKKSIADLQEVLRYGPEKHLTLTLMNLFSDTGDKEKALKVAESVAGDNPKDKEDAKTQAWIVLDAGVYSASLGKPTEARQYFDLGFELMKKFNLGVEWSQASRFILCRMVNDLSLGDIKRTSALDMQLTMAKSLGPDGGVILMYDGLMFQAMSWLASTLDFVRSTRVGKNYPPTLFYGYYEMFHLAMDEASLQKGLLLEFGVWHGLSLRKIASRFPDNQVHGFDSFEGLPEDWNENPAGSYSAQGALPTNLPDNVHLQVGLFAETLPSFLEANPGPIRFMNVDCDIYSSTKTIFDHVYDRIVPGTVIHFDEYTSQYAWEKHEHKAFCEAVEEHGWEFEYVAISLYSKKAVVRITGVPRNKKSLNVTEPDTNE